MWKDTKLIINKKPIVKKLLEYGFNLQGQTYAYYTKLLDDTFFLNVYVDNNGLTFEIIDCITKEEYTLAYTNSAEGAFVGKVRAQYEKILIDIVAKCFEPNFFNNSLTSQVVEYAKNTYGSTAEYLWEETSSNAILRNKHNNKWYAVLLMVEREKIGLIGEDLVEIINLKAQPCEVENLIDGKKYFPAYHMNKKHWYTMCLDGSIPLEEIYKRLDVSYKLVCQKGK